DRDGLPGRCGTGTDDDGDGAGHLVDDDPRGFGAFGRGLSVELTVRAEGEDAVDTGGELTADMGAQGHLGDVLVIVERSGGGGEAASDGCHGGSLSGGGVVDRRRVSGCTSAGSQRLRRWRHRRR